jgi:predicted PurR-regulated permease PerM
MRWPTLFAVMGFLIAALVGGDLAGGYVQSYLPPILWGVTMGVLAGLTTEKLERFPADDGRRRIHALSSFVFLVLVTLCIQLVGSKASFTLVALVSLAAGFIFILDMASIALPRGKSSERTSQN